jgi:hypothetical protein
MGPVIEYLSKGKLPQDRDESWRIQTKAKQYTIEEGVMYKKAYLVPPL